MWNKFTAGSSSGLRRLSHCQGIPVHLLKRTLVVEVRLSPRVHGSRQIRLLTEYPGGVCQACQESPRLVPGNAGTGTPSRTTGGEKAGRKGTPTTRQTCWRCTVICRASSPWGLTFFQVLASGRYVSFCLFNAYGYKLQRCKASVCESSPVQNVKPNLRCI